MEDSDMTYLIVLLFFYLLTFVPAVFSYGTAAVALLTLLLYIFRRRERVSIYILFMILLFSLFSSSLDKTIMYIPIDRNEICGIYGTVVTEPNRKKNRYTGYSIMCRSVANEKGDLFSSSGKIYIIGPDLSVTRGDSVYVEGMMSENYFLSTGGAVLSENIWGRIRRKFNASFISSLPGGDRGNIISLLLTGTTLDGESNLQDRVRELGLSHMLSLSGMHLSFMTALFMPLLSLFLSKRKAGAVKNLILLVFVYLAGMRVSLVRSLIFVFLIPLFGIEYSFIFSLVFLLKLFPYYVDEVSAVLSFTSLAGILFIAKPQERIKKSRIPFLSTTGVVILTSVAATVASAPVVYSIFGLWQPYSFLFSVIGMPIITMLFILTLVRFIIPISDLIIDVILWIINNSGVLSQFLPLTESFSLYYPVLALFTAIVALTFLVGRRKRR